MESIMGGASKTFEDRATLAMINRALPVPSFTHNEAGGVLTITTAAVTLSYTLGAGFTPASLSVVGTAGGAFTKWTYGDAFPGNLLGTIRGQDGQSATPLNCTVNAGVDDNGAHGERCALSLVVVSLDAEGEVAVPHAPLPHPPVPQVNSTTASGASSLAMGGWCMTIRLIFASMRMTGGLWTATARASRRRPARTQ